MLRHQLLNNNKQRQLNFKIAYALQGQIRQKKRQKKMPDIARCGGINEKRQSCSIQIKRGNQIQKVQPTPNLN